MKNELELIQTYGACPEQYDLNFNNINIGYLKLRHGHFSAEHVPTGEIVYTASPEGDGIFADSEREGYLEAATQAILKHHLMNQHN